MTDSPHHGHSLHEDLPHIRRLMERRRALRMFGSAAGIATGLAGGLLRWSPASASKAACIADPQETSGPYPADGTNQSQGVTSDILTESGVVRRDLRPSFLGTGTTAEGVPVQLFLAMTNETAGCPEADGLAIYVWHCDRDGNYSLYGAPTDSYLRGVQVSNARGRLHFTTIFPACYSGRWPHIHIEVFASLSEATNGANAILTTQLAMPSDICNDVYDNATGYSASKANFANASLSTDMVFGTCTAAQLAVMTPGFKGSIADGYRAHAAVNVAM